MRSARAAAASKSQTDQTAMNLPNQLTLLRILLTPVFVSLLFVENLFFKIAAFLLYVIASITDYYDGYTARKQGIITLTGQFLDPLADKILVSSSLISFNLLGYVPTWMVLIIVIRDFLITGFRSFAILKHKPIITHRLAKLKTYLQMVVLYFIFIYHLVTWSGTPAFLKGTVDFIHEWSLIYAVMFGITALTVFTGVLYLIENRSHVKAIATGFFRMFIPSDV
jgi:CDP-diacylglycerol---glycerol-3-phosphate 3-phosphatidyltransferase